MNLKKIKSDFPIFLKYAQAEKIFVSLDNAATTHKPQFVIDSIVDFYTKYNSNVHRGLYDSGEQATVMYEQAREKLAKFINAEKSSEIIFTSGTTEGINFVAQTWATQNLKHGDEILLTQAEHHSNLLPWQRVAKATGAILKFIPINKETFKIDNPEQYLTSKTRFVAVTYISNVLGDIWPNGQLEKLIIAAKKVKAKILIDAAQAVAHRKIDVQALNVDFMAFSGHKMFGPTGVGILYVKSDLHDKVEPYQVGGGMVYSVSFESASWAKSPQKFEAGTPPIAQAIALGITVDYITDNLKFDSVMRHEASLCSELLSTLTNFQSIKIVGNFEEIRKKGHLISFAVKGVHAHDIAGFLGKNGVSVRAGHHCAQPLVKELGFESLVRISFAVYNNSEDVQVLVEKLKEVLKFFGVE